MTVYMVIKLLPRLRRNSVPYWVHNLNSNSTRLDCHSAKWWIIQAKDGIYLSLAS